MPSAGEPPSHTARCAATLPELHGAAVGAPDARRACLRRRGRPRGFPRLRSRPATRGLARRRYRSSTAPASVRPPLAAQAPRAWLEAAGSHGCSRDCAARRRVHKPARPLYLGRSPESHRSLRGDGNSTAAAVRAAAVCREGPRLRRRLRDRRGVPAIGQPSVGCHLSLTSYTAPPCRAPVSAARPQASSKAARSHGCSQHRASLPSRIR